MRTGKANLASALILRLRTQRLRRAGLAFRRPRALGRNVRVRCSGQSELGGTLRAGEKLWLEDGVILDAWGGAIEIGEAVFIGPYAVVYGHGGVRIGDHSLISMHCRILSSNHEIPRQGVAIRSQPDRHAATEIGRDVWLGAGVTVLAGVTIGEGAVVGAGSVVTKDLPAGAIAFGNPAKVHDYREGAEPA